MKRLFSTLFSFFIVSCVMLYASCGTSKAVAGADGSNEVNVGYGTIGKDDLNSPVSKVEANEKTDQSNYGATYPVTCPECLCAEAAMAPLHRSISEA